MRIDLRMEAMDLERLRGLAATYRSRADAVDNELVRNYENDTACYIESVIAWIEARIGREVSNSDSMPSKPAGAERTCG
jgi:hypothetical protein